MALLDSKQLNPRLTGSFTLSGSFAGDSSSSGSFGRLEFTKISGDASQMTNVNEVGHVSGAAQLATRISGAMA